MSLLAGGVHPLFGVHYLKQQFAVAADFGYQVVAAVVFVVVAFVGLVLAVGVVIWSKGLAIVELINVAPPFDVVASGKLAAAVPNETALVMAAVAGVADALVAARN